VSNAHASPHVIANVVNGLGHLRLDRPDKRNAVDAKMLSDARTALASLTSAGVTVAVLEGSGPAFCSGGDRSEAGTGARSSTELALLFAATPIFFAARVHGGAVGGGVALAAVCPLVVCTPEAWFDLPEARAGFLPSPVLAFLEPSLGARRALQACLFPERISAERAVELGLAEHVVSADGIDAFLEERLQRLVASPRLAAAATRAWQSQFATDAFRVRFAELMALLD
jgi:enoyl-CoA hydratase/carnithine racemase